MKYRLLGHSGLRVSELSLGTMTFGEDWGWGAAKEESRKIYDAYREAGGNNAVLANVVVDLRNRPEPGSLAERAKVSLVCPSDEARQRLKRIEQIGFDEVLIVSPAGALDEIERVRDFL